MKDLRAQLCKLRGQNIVVLSDNFFSIVCGVVDKVTCGTVELTSAEVFTVPVPNKVILSIDQINTIVPLSAGSACPDFVATLIAARQS